MAQAHLRQGYGGRRKAGDAATSPAVKYPVDLLASFCEEAGIAFDLTYKPKTLKGMRNIPLLRLSFCVNTIKHTALQLVMALVFAVIGYAEPGHTQGVLDREVTLNIKEKSWSMYCPELKNKQK